MLVKHDGGWVRTKRMNQIAQKIASDLREGKAVEIKKLLAWIGVTIGLTDKTATEYIDKLVILYSWQIKDGFITM